MMPGDPGQASHGHLLPYTQCMGITRAERSRQWREQNRELDLQRKREWYARNRERIRMSKHDGAFEELFARQEGLCYLCEEPFDLEKVRGDRYWCIDHDHRCCPPNRSCSTCRRGLAHMTCNRIIGLAGNDPDRMRRIAANFADAEKIMNQVIAIATS